MKKTLIALAIAAVASTAANATVIYSQDGTKIDLDGRVALQIANQTGKRTDLLDKGSRLRVRAFQEIGNGFTALGAAEIRFTQNGTVGDGIHTKRLFAGLTHADIGSLTFGRQLTVGDHIGLSDYTYELGSIVKVVDAHNKAAHFMSAEFNGFRFGADYYFGNADKTYVEKDKDGNVTKTGYSADNGQGFGLGAFYKTKIDEFGFAVEGGYSELTKGDFKANEYKAKGAGAAIELSYGPAALAFDWSQAKSPVGHSDHKFRVGDVKNEKVDQFEVGFKYHVTPQNKVYAEYLWGIGKTQGEENDKFKGWFLGADHHFNKHVILYVEGGSFKTKNAGETVEKEKRIALGTRILF
ncbi:MULTISPECIES: porin [Pasteurellaceae]|uniref:porin n=1 Tax=Pasteurellaceae TaxID=712 RepID=UPI0035619EBF